MHLPLSLQLDRIIQGALEEDLGSGDVGSSLLFAEDIRSRAFIQAKDIGIVAGLPVAQATFQKLALDLVWNLRKRDGERVSPGEIVADIDGPVRAILAGERVALNFLQRLSGIATLTGRFVDAVQDFTVRILDTRKTAPGLRILDKYAVRAGGGFNHRFGLYDGILIKDNHVRAAGGVREALNLIRRNARPMLKIEVEITSVEEAQEAAEARHAQAAIYGQPGKCKKMVARCHGQFSDSAGMPAMLAGIVQRSSIFKASGSPVSSPSLNATTGEVGDRTKSNRENVSSNSRVIIARTVCALT